MLKVAGNCLCCSDRICDQSKRSNLRRDEKSDMSKLFQPGHIPTYKMVSAISSSSYFPHSWRYDVFVSFRGQDTRYNFVDHLFSALHHKGINTFIDNDIIRGQELSSTLVAAIEASSISVIVFSENYASSKWCLDELVKILQCKHSNKQIVYPIFYKVDPSDVRNQRGTYGEVLAYHENQFQDNMEKVFGWRAALTEAANLAGWSILDGYESTFIHNIVGEISVKVNRNYLHVADYPVGMQSRVLHVNMLLDVKEKDVRMVGIWGTGGIGKTTVAKAVYNSIFCEFEGSCFLANVRENSMQDGGLVELQNTFLCEILGDERLKVKNVDKGINVIKKMLSHKRVLLVLDDVNHLDQLKKLVGGVDWFGMGSRIIITTRDKHLLTAHQINLIYKVKELNYHEATVLFSWNAFGRNRHQVDELKFHTAVQYVQGLPLALIVLGSCLCGRSTDQWKAALDCYKRVPNQEIQNILKISYNALEDPVKEVFLDIACFFKGKKRNYVIETLESCELNPEYCIEVLIDNAIISIDERDHIWMHDLLEEMGREIVRQESPTEPGRRSRLWFHEDVYHVLTENTGTDNIKGIMVNFPNSDAICLNAESFSRMKNLRVFITCNSRFSGDVEYLPNQLRILDWPQCPLQSFPSNFNPRKLVKLNMPRSHMTRLGEGFKSLHNVKSINFCSCKFLKRIPDFSGIPNLVYLNLNYCKSLVEVHPSVGFLKKLVHLTAEKCSSLVMFPPRLSLRSLETFLLGGCRKLKNFPEIAGTMESLKCITLSGTAIRELPSSIGCLSGLQELNLNKCEDLINLPCSIYELEHLQYLFLDSCPKLVAFPNAANSEVPCTAKSLPLVLPKLLRFNMGGCSLSKSDFLATLDCVSTLQELDLSGSNFVSLPVCIIKFVNLLDLNLCCCERLREIPQLPPKVGWVDVSNCKSLETFPKLSDILESHELQGLEWIYLFNCHRLCDSMNYEVAKMDNVLLNQVSSKFEIILPGSEVPKWFSCRMDPNFICEFLVGYPLGWISICELCIEIPQNLKRGNIGLALCAIFECTQSNSADYCFRAQVLINDGYRGRHEFHFYSRQTESAHVWLKYIPLETRPKMDKVSWLLPDMCKVKFYCSGNSGLVSFKSCGVHVICHQVDDTMSVNGTYAQEQWLSSSLEPMNGRKRKHPSTSDNT